MRYFRTLLSALTFFGGHVLNRRLDRVVIIFSALMAIGIASYLAFPFLIFHSLGTDLVAWAMRAPAILIIATAVTSAIVTWVDAAAPRDTALSVGSRIAGAIVAVGGLLLLWTAMLSLLSVRVSEGQSPRIAESSSPQRSSVFHRSLHTSTHLGGYASGSELQPPPAGPHALRGRVVMDGKPVRDAEMQLLLNRTFETDTLSTDRRGEFVVRLPAGRWFINRVTLTDWNQAPEGRVLLLFSEREPPKGTGQYSRYDFRNNTGFEVGLPTPDGSDIPAFELRDAINVEWPETTSLIMDDGAPAPMADIATSTISWTPVASAAEYEIQLSSIKREGSSTHYNSILTRRQADAKLRLADLPQRASETPEPDEYSVAIYAFDSSGRLLTQTAEHPDEIAFSLAATKRLAEERFAGSQRMPDNTEQFRNLERLSLVSGLLDHKQIDAARAILNEVTDDAPAGRKAAMQGAIEALTGNCAAALPLFDKADADGGTGCAPLKYRRLCDAK